MADTTGTVTPDDFHATSEPAAADAEAAAHAASLIVGEKPASDAAAADAEPAADAATGDITTKDFHATSEPLVTPDDFHATDQKA
ncbi:hypothetical protein ACGF3G_23570 [Streptomyces sp. NPDC048179]|uniref:hypothetical protein n=1 Tax=unclassified Streptomyces TaxID=2593676 RepID=UPI00370FE559